jgi:5'-3' exonuclease
MGIQGLTPFLKKFAPSAFSTVHLSTFAKKKIAIDISLFLYKYKVVYGEQWLSGILHMLSLLRSYSIHPIIVFDGEAPLEKMEEQQNRRASREERTQKYNTITSCLDTFNSTGIVANELQEFYNKQATKFGVNSKFDVDLVVSQLDKLKNQNVKINYSDIELVQELMDTMSIPYFQAPSEAEGMCSWLCKKSLVEAVLTEDTDVLAYGANKFISKLNLYSATCTQIEYKSVLDSLTLDNDKFIEFCIMCGCDYNQRVKGLGPVRAYKMLLKHDCIEHVIKNYPKIDFSPLKYNRVKEMFTVPCSDTLDHLSTAVDLKCGKPDFQKLSNFMYTHELTDNGSMSFNPQYIYNSCLQDIELDDDFKLVKSIYKRRKSPSIKI